ncbi:hypothetical protein [Nocardioides sp. GXQ0305]|uniref:hypothetical protein n=1 Tax=Nocardioides sp. GXQ0305 TaxID=3423912 RepID=UPI003D7C8AEF
MRVLAVTVALTVALLAGCSEDPQSAPDPSEPSESASESASPSESPSASPTRKPRPSKPPEDELEADLLDWRPVPGSVDDEVTVSGKWRLTRAADGSRAQLSGPAGATYRPPAGFTYSDVLMDGQFAVVVAQHEQETKPNVAEVVDLSNGAVTRIDGRSDPATTTGGSWALGSGFLVHATRDGGDYCLATVDLLAGRGRLGPCVPPRNGISNALVTPAGTSAMTFDDGRPSCRTLNRVEGTKFRPVAGVTECKGWDVATTETAAVWSEIPDEKRIEAAEFFADTGSGPVELGPGTSGTLTWCGDAAYFVRDPQRDDEPARLVRVRDGEATVVYESPGGGKAFLGAPRCGGTDLTVTAFSAAGDEQVTTRLR